MKNDFSDIFFEKEKFDCAQIKIGPNAIISGDGLIEETASVNGGLYSRFVIGSYTSIGMGARCTNMLVGRFSTIEDDCIIGYSKIFKNSFSINNFARGKKMRLRMSISRK